MGTTKLSVIRSRFKTAIEAIVGAGLTQSPMPYEAFGRTPNSIAHKSFAVGVLSSVAQQDRQKPNVGSLTITTIDIKMTYRIRPLAQITDVGNTMDLENDIIIALCNRAYTTLYENIHIKFTNLSRSLVDSGEYMLSSIGFEIMHYIPLQ